MENLEAITEARATGGLGAAPEPEKYDMTDVERVTHTRPAPGPSGHRADRSSGTQILRAGSVALLTALTVLARHGLLA